MGARRVTVLTKRMSAFARRQKLKSETIHIPQPRARMTDMLQRSLRQSNIYRKPLSACAPTNPRRCIASCQPFCASSNTYPEPFVTGALVVGLPEGTRKCSIRGSLSV